MGAGRHLTRRGDEDGLFGSAFEGGLEVESQPGFALMGIGVPSSCRKTTAGLFAVFDLEYLSLFLLFPDEAATGGVGEAPADSTLTLFLSRSPSTSRTSWQRMVDDDGGFIADFDLEYFSLFLLFPEETTTGGVGESPADSILTLFFSRSPSASRTSWQRMEDDDDGLIAGGSGFGSENLTAFFVERPGVLDGDLFFGREGDGDRLVVTTVLEARGNFELDDGTEARASSRASRS